MACFHAARAALTLLLLSHPARAIITKEDPSDAIVTDRSSAKFFVSLFERGDCAGTVIADKFVVTAAHCVCSAAGIRAIDYQDEKYEAVKSYRNPGRLFNCKRDGPNSNDVAVLEFDDGVFANHDPRPVYSGSDEVGKTIWILGMGISGRPDDYASAKECRKGKEDKELREGFNIVNSADDGVIKYDMSRDSLEREATAQDGDSGGPALIEADGKWLVAGANSGTNENNSCDWGSVDQYCRLSEHSAWIRAAMDETRDDSSRGLWETYGSSDDCEDDASFLWRGKEGQDCEWVGEKKGRKKRLCRKKPQGKKVCESCCATCGVHGGCRK